MWIPGRLFFMDNRIIMIYKISISIFCTTIMFSAMGQYRDTIPMFNKNSLIGLNELKCSIIDPRRLTKKEYPLIIINNQRFKYSSLSNFYFDISTISQVHVINSKNDSNKLYGKAGRNGIIILQTKNKISWISSRKIIRLNLKGLFHSHRKIILKINKTLIDPWQEVYIQKDLIQSIKVEKVGLNFFINKI